MSVSIYTVLAIDKGNRSDETAYCIWTNIQASFIPPWDCAQIPPILCDVGYSPIHKCAFCSIYTESILQAVIYSGIADIALWWIYAAGCATHPGIMSSYGRVREGTFLVIEIIGAAAISEVADRGYRKRKGKQCECERDLFSHVVEWGSNLKVLMSFKERKGNEQKETNL